MTRHVQWGFQVKGVNVWVTDLAPYGTAVVGPASVVPTTLADLGRPEEPVPVVRS